MLLKRTGTIQFSNDHWQKLNSLGQYEYVCKQITNEELDSNSMTYFGYKKDLYYLHSVSIIDKTKKASTSHINPD